MLAWDKSTYHLHLDSVGQLEIELLVPYQGVALIQLVELSFLEEQHSVKVLLLDSPELGFEWRKLFPRFLRYVDRTPVVLGVSLRVTRLVSYVLLEKEIEAFLRLSFGLFGF